MNTLPVQAPPALNAVVESTPKSKPADKPDSSKSFQNVLKEETAAREQSKTESSASSDQAGNTQEQTQTQAQAPSQSDPNSTAVKQETAETTDKTDEPTATAAAADAGAMAQLLALASQFTKTDSKPAETTTFDAASAHAKNAAVALAPQTAAVSAAVSAAISAPVLAADGSPAAVSAKGDTTSLLPRSPTDKAVTSTGHDPVQLEKTDEAASREAFVQQQPSNPMQEKGAQVALVTAEASTLRQNTDKNVDTPSQAATPAAFDSLHRAAIDKLETKAGAPVDRIAPNVGTSAWDQAVSQKVVWMVSNEQQSASLTLNPPELGPLQVTVNVSDNQATAHFVSAHPEVRQALENAIPRLREMLGEAGIQLGQAHVGAGTAGDFTAQSGQHQSSQQSAQSGNTSHPTQSEIRVPVRTAKQGLVDTFA